MHTEYHIASLMTYVLVLHKLSKLDYCSVADIEKIECFRIWMGLMCYLTI